MIISNFKFQRDIPIIDKYDLVVAGGGPGGVAAAIAAARLGVKVLLVEALGCLGGIGTSGMVCVWMNLSEGNNLLAQGIFYEILHKLYEYDGLSRDDLCIESGVGYSYVAAKCFVDATGTASLANYCVIKSDMRLLQNPPQRGN